MVRLCLLRWFALVCLFWYYITLKVSHTLSTSNVQNINFDLSTYDKYNVSSHSFVRNINLAEGNAIVTITNASSNIGFFVIQAHSLYSNVCISTTDDLVQNTFINGTNVGLVLQNLASLQSFYVKYVENPMFERVLLAVVAYEKSDPIPGGCNMVFNNEIAPYQLISYNDYMITVDVQPSAVSKRICEQNPTRLSFYHLYLKERILDETEYFNSIQSMLTVDKIKTNAKLIPLTAGESYIRRYYSAYNGFGSVFAVIAHYGNLSSAYVPAVTYACDINNWGTNCVGPVSVTWKILCAVFIFLGIFTCYYGHRFFKTQMFIFGFVFGGFVSYISASLDNTLPLEQSVGISLLFGCIYGGTWLIFWWRFGSPALSVFLPVSFVGYLTACIVFYTGISDMSIFHNDLNYWGIFLTIAFPITALLLIVTQFANILACSVLGSTATIIALDHYVSGSLHYIIVNNVRRATVPKFNRAILDPPDFNRNDIILCVAWLGFVLTGVYVQLRQQRGKPPFPPSAASTRGNPELTPLLSRNYSNQQQVA